MPKVKENESRNEFIKRCIPITKKVKDETGKKYGKLTVLGYIGSKGKKQLAYWLCECECGNYVWARGSSLRNGSHKSCGCIHDNSWAKKEKGVAAFNQLYNQYRCDAKKRGLFFSITKEQFKKLTSANCHYCNSKPSFVSKTRSNNGIYIYNGIDRIDNSQGYLLNNLVSCCKICNGAKCKSSYDDFILWIKKVYNNVYRGEK